MNRMRKGQMRGVEKGDSRGRLPFSPACLEWQPKLNRKVSLHVHNILPDFLQQNPYENLYTRARNPYPKSSDPQRFDSD
jgi:hypothetical protein